MLDSEMFARDGGDRDWQVQLSSRRDAWDGEYDIVVVGSGIGGLSCAALLSKWGYRVLVLEHHTAVGGYYGSFERGRFRFNVAAMELTGLWEGGPFDLLLRDLGLQKEEYFTPNSYRYVLGSWKLEPFDRLEDLVEQLLTLFPDEAQDICHFFGDAELAHDEWFRDGSRFGTPLPLDLAARVFGGGWLQQDVAQRPHYHDWLGKTWGHKLDDHFHREGARNLLDFLLNHLHLDPYKTPAEVALRSMGFLRFGSFYPIGGAQKLSNALRDGIRKQGGTVLLGRRVEEILATDGGVCGVRVGAEVFPAAVVVSNGCIKNTILDLLDPAAVDSSYLVRVKEITMQVAYSMVFLGVDMDLSGYPTITQILDPDRGEFFLVAINSNADTSYAPPGMASVTIYGLANYHDYPPRGTPDYQRLKEAAASHLIELASRVIPDLPNRIVLQDAATPRTFERYTLAPEGSGEGIYWSTEVALPWFKTPVPGLYLVGSSTYPGSGVELAIMSGIICANDIDGWKPRGRRGCAA